jgi:hypothetical protein
LLLISLLFNNKLLIMKKSSIKMLLFSFLVAGASLSASAQIYVKIRPVMPVVVQTERPGPAHVWIGEEWREDGGNYTYAGGYWGAPPQAGYRWYPGHWNHHRRHGDQWVRGGWRR